MRYFHCPKIFKRKPYGCGRGPYNGTQAFLDLNSRCPCGKALKPYKAPKLAPSTVTCAVRGLASEPYCGAPVVAGSYCRRHAYLNHSTPVTA